MLGLSGRSWWRTGLTSWKGTDYTDEMSKAVRILPSAETEGFFIAKIVKK